MPQFTVYKNINEKSRKTFPYLIDVQNDILNDLDTRVVIPVCSSSDLGNKPIQNLSPITEIEGKKHILLTSQLAGIPKSELGPQICDLSEQRYIIISALDFLFTGF